MQTYTNKTTGWIALSRLTSWLIFHSISWLCLSASLPMLEAKEVSQAASAPEKTSSADATESLTVVDPSVRGWERLVERYPGRVLLLQPGRDALHQVSERLKQERGLQRLSWVTEGEPGALELSSESLSFERVTASRESLQSWKRAFAPGADMLLYGCRIAQGTRGKQFVQNLASLTGLDVAASTDATGSTALGGDLHLEFHVGSIERLDAALESELAQLPAVLGYNDMPNVSNPGPRSSPEDTQFVFGTAITVNEPGSDRMEAVVRLLSGNGILSDGEVSNAELASQGSRSGLNSFFNSLAFVPAANWNGTAQIQVTVTSDFNNRTAGNTLSFNFNLTITPVNDAPIASGASSLPVVDEDTVSPPGATVTSLFSARFADETDNVSGGSTAHSLAGVAVVANTVNASQGQWQYYDGSSWINVGTRTASSTLLLPVGDSLRFLPATNWFGTPSGLTLRLIDNSSGAVTRGAGPDLSSAANYGGSRVYSAATVALSTSVTPVNDAPLTSNFTVNGTKNQVATFSLSSQDADTGTNTSTDAVVTNYRVVTIPANGTLRTSNNVILSAANTDITVAQATGMTFTPTANFEGSSSFTFRAIDAANALSNTSTVTLDIQPFNEPPVVSAPATATVDEDSTQSLIGSVSLADPDAGSAVIRATITATQGNVTLSQLTGLRDAATGGAAITQATFSNLTFFGTISNLNAAMTGLRFTPIPNYFGPATIEVTVNDLANTGNPAKQDSKSIAVTVTNLPDAPATGSGVLAAVNEDTLSPPGASVQSLLPLYNDNDNDAIAGIAISANPANATTEGRWQYSINSGVSWSNVGAVSSSAALLLSRNALLRFLPVQHYFGTPAALTVHAVDSSNGRTFTTHPNTRLTLNANLAASDFDSLGGQISTSITSVNDAFTVANDYPLLVDEGGTSVLTSGLLSVVDVEANPTQVVYTILSPGTQLSEGAFQFDVTGAGGWSNLSAGSTFTQAHINAGRLRYVHQGNEPAVAQTLAYSVTDQLPAAGGTSQTKVLNILVTPVNDAPQLYVPGQNPPGDPVPLSANVAYGSSLTFGTSNLRVLDSDNLNVQLILRIESLPTHGDLFFNSAPVAVGSVFSYADLGLFTYQHDGVVSGPDSFALSLRDGAGGIVGALGGNPASPISVSLNVLPFNNPPSVVDALTEILERDTNAPLAFSVSDVETLTHALTVRLLSLPPAADAVLLFNGSPVTQAMLDAPGGMTFSASQVSLLRLNHVSTNRLNPPNFSFNIRVTDDALVPAVTDATISVAVRAVDDEPTLAVNHFNVNAPGGTFVLTDSELNGDDIDTPPGTLLYRVVTRPVNGNLRLNGTPLGVGGTFTQADVDAGRITYRHRGRATTTDSFQVTLRDQGFNIRYNRPGGVYPDAVSTTLTVHTVNVTIPAGGTNPGGSGTSGNPGDAGLYPAFAETDYAETDKNIPLVLDEAELLANDGGITPFHITAVEMAPGYETHGVVSLNPTTAEVTFTPTLNFSGETRFLYTMEDAIGRSAEGEVIVTVYFVNYPPTIAVNDPLVLSEGAEGVVSASLLRSDDVDDAVASIAYTLLTVPNNGVLYLDATPGDSVSDAQELLAGDLFTQDDINQGKIKFVHDGQETFGSTFRFRVTDGASAAVPVEPAFATFTIDATPINDAPVISTSNIVLQENSSIVLTPAMLSASDVDGVGSDKVGQGFATINNLTFSMAVMSHAALHGTLEKNGVTGWAGIGVGEDFTAADVAAGLIRYVHNGGENYDDQITFTVNDNTGEANATATAVMRIGIVPVNDDPVLVKNDPLSLDEAATAFITFADHLQSNDPDNTDTQLQYRLTTATQFGTLWRDGTEALGVGSKFTQQEVKSGRISYQHNGSEATSDSFQFTLSDGGGGVETADTFRLMIRSLNDAPTISLPYTSIFAVESDETDVRGITVADPDSIHPVTQAIDPGFGPLDMVLTLAVNGGTLQVRQDLALVVGNGTGLVTVQGLMANINSTLASLTYTAGPVAAATGSDTLVLQFNDFGNTGAGGPLSDTENLSIIMLGVNTPPVVTVPAAQFVDEEAQLVFSSANGNAISFADPDIALGSATATISALNGSLSLGGVAGLTSVSGNNTSTVTFTGSQSAINSALNGLTYQGLNQYHGSDTLTITVNDQGNTGTFGGPLSTSRGVSITVRPVNDVPTVANADHTMDEEGTLTFSLSSAESDTGLDAEDDALVTHYYVRLRATASPTVAGFVGQLRTSNNVVLGTSNSVTPPGFAPLSNGEHIITAAQATLMTYTPPQHFNSDVDVVGADWRSALEFRAIDILASDFATSSKSSAAVVNVDVNAVNDAPVLSGGGDTVAYTEGNGLNLMGSATILNAANNLVLTDIELTEQAEDDFAGVTLTVRRASSAVATDRFLIAEVGGISLSGSNVVIGGQTRAVITNNSQAGTLVVTFNANATASHVTTLMRSVAYASVANDLHGDITASMILNDGNDGGQGSGAPLNSNAITFTIQVQNVNDSPSFSSNGMIVVSEDTLAPTGASIQSIMGGFFADPDPSSLPAGQFTGIAVAADASNQATQGRWQYSPNGTIWLDVTPLATPPDHVSATQALLLNKDSLLRFIPVANFNDRFQQLNTPAGALTVVAVDGSGTRTWTTAATRQFTNTVTGWTDVSDLGSAVPALVRANVTQVNDQPTISNLNDDSTFTEAVGVNVAGPAVLLDDAVSGLASMGDIDLTLRQETTFNGARLVVRAQTIDTFDFFLPQIAGGISLSGAFTNPGPGIILFNNGSLVRYNSVTIGTLTDNSSVTGQLVITLNANATQAAVNAILQNLAYSNNNPALGLSIKPIDITFHDGNGSANNGQGTGGELSTTVTVNMNLVPRNDSPLLTQGTTIVTSEDVTSTAATFYTLLGSYFQDPDELSIPASNDLDGVAISAFNNAGLGQWQISLDGSSWTALTSMDSLIAGGISSTRALLLTSGTRVRFVPNLHANTAGSVTKPSLAIHPVERAVPTGAHNSGAGQSAGPITFTSDLAAPLIHDTTAHPLESRVAGASVVLDAQINSVNDAPSFGLTTVWTGTLVESPVNNIGTTPPQQLLSGAAVVDVDPSTTNPLVPTVFGAGSVTVSLSGGVSGDRLFIAGNPGGILSQSGGLNGTNLVVNFSNTTTFAQVNAILEAIRFEHTTDNPPTAARSYSVTLNDGNNLGAGGVNAGGPLATTALATGEITIVQVNDPPLLTAAALNPSYVEDSVTSVLLYSTSNVNATGDGQEIVQLRLTLAGIGNGADELLRIDGSEISLTNGASTTTSGLGAVINVSVSGATATVTLTHSGLTESQFNTILNGLAYRNSSHAFAGSTRVVSLTYLQDDGGIANGGVDTNTSLGVATSTVTLQPRNDAPVLAATLLNPTVTEEPGAQTGTSSVSLLGASSVADVDFTNSSFGGGRIIVNFSTYVTGDQLFIPNDTAVAIHAVRANGSNVQISLDGTSWTTVATVDGTSNGQARELVLQLNSSTNEQNLGYILDAIRFRSTSDNPTVNGTRPNRGYAVVVVDGNNNNLAGGPAELNSNTLSGGIITISMLNDMVIADINGAGAGTNRSTTWNEAANATHVAVSMASDTMVTDPDNANVIRLTLTAAGLLDGNSEVLRIAGTDFVLGSNANNVDVGAFLVTYQSATGVFTIVPDGATTSTLAAYQTLLRSLSYNNTTDNPTTGPRVFSVMLTDAGPNDDGVDGLDGGVSSVTVNVVPNNDQPVIGSLTPAVFMENAINATAATIDADVTLADIDSPSYSGGSITVSGLISGQDVVSLPTSSVAVAGAIQINGGNVEYHDGSNWIVVGTHAGGNGSNFVVSLVAGSDRAICERILESLTFANTSHNPTLSRVLTYTVNDGGANPPLPSTLTVTIRLENDAPVLAATTLGAGYTEGTAAVALMSGTIAVTDVDQPANFYNSASSIGGLVVSLVSYQPGDLLTVANVGSGAGQIGVSGSVISFAGLPFASFSGGNEADLIVTLTSNSATPAAIQALLGALRYRNSGDDPTVKGTEPTRAFEVVFNDGANTKDASSTTTALTASLSGLLTLTDVNDAPELDLDDNNSSGALVADYRTVFVNGGSAVTVVDLDASLLDRDHALLQSLTLQLTNALDGAQEGLQVSGPLPAGISTGGYNPATRTLVFTGPATPDDFEDALRLVQYLNSDSTPTLGDRRIEVSANDGINHSNLAVSTVRVIDVTVVTTTPVNEASAYAFFTVEGTAGEPVTLALGNTADGSDQDATIAGFTLQYRIGAGVWTDYTWNGVSGNRPTLPGSLGAAGHVLVRVGIVSESDVTFEGEETFHLTASVNNGGGRSSTAVCSILDDGTGVIHQPDGTIHASAIQDDDRLMSVTGLTVNEGSPFAVFTVTGEPGQRAALSVVNETTTGLGTIQYLSGGVWTNYSSGWVILPGTTMLVRVALTPEQEQAVDLGETFKLVATNTGGTGSSGGTAVIHDNATGDYYLANNLTSTPNPGQLLDDDRPVTITNLTVNEGSPYAVFTASAVTGQWVTLSINNVTTTGLTGIQYLSGTNWIDYPSGLLAFADNTMIFRVALSPEQEALFDVGEIFHLVATNTGGGASSGGVGTIMDDETGDFFRTTNTTTTPDPGQILDDDRPVVLRWANAGANPTLGLLDSTIIPNTTTSPVLYPGTNGGRFDVQLTTTGLSGNGLAMMGGEVCWYFNGHNSATTSRVNMRFYRPGTTTPKHLTNIHFSIEDSESFEELSSFSYFDAVGNRVFVPWTNSSIFTYSHAPLYGSSGMTVENRAPIESRAQSGKWIRVNLRGIAVSGFEFGYRRRSGLAGSIMLTHPAGEPGSLGFAGNFTPITLNTGANGTASIPDYRTQTTRSAGVTGTIQQIPAPNTNLNVGVHYVTLQLVSSDSRTATLGFDLVVVDRTPPSIAAPAGGFPQLTSTQAFPDYASIAVITDNVGVARVSQSPLPGTIVNTGVNKLTLTAVDVNGNTNVQSFDILAAPAAGTNQVNHSSIVSSGADARPYGAPEGFVFASFGLPAIHDSGAVAFQAVCRNGRATMTGIFTGVVPQLVVASGQPVPGVPGARFVSFYDPCMNQGADTQPTIAFLAKISTGALGVWSNVSGQFQLVALSSQAAPGTQGALFRDFSSISLAEGELLLSATLAGSATTANNQGVWTWNPEEGATLLMRRGQSITCAFGSAKTVSRIDMLGSVPNTPGQSRHHLAAGTYLARVACTDGTLINLMTDEEGHMAPIAQNQWELIPGLKPTSIGIPAGSLPGHVAFQQVFASARGNGVTAANNAGILYYGNNGWSLPVRKGATVPGRLGTTWTSLTDPVVNGTGCLAWTGTVKPATGAMVPVIGYCASGGLPQVVVERGSNASGVPGATFANFTSMALPEGIGPVFIASLQIKSNVVTTADDTGVWAVDSEGQLRLLLREGQWVGTKRTRSFSLLQTTPGSLGQTRSFNRHGQIISRLLFSDNTQSLMLSEVP